jgi:hypothetical protein
MQCSMTKILLSYYVVQAMLAVIVWLVLWLGLATSLTCSFRTLNFQHRTHDVSLTTTNQTAVKVRIPYRIAAAVLTVSTDGRR